MTHRTGVSARSWVSRIGLPAFAAVFLVPGSILGRSDGFVVSAIETRTPPVIDGMVGEEEWKGGSEVGDFIQFVPDKGKPASVRTVVRILYDQNALYFAFLCEDPEPEKVQLGPNRRDNLASTTGTDSVTVELDTFDDDRSAYYFRTNPLGVQHDGRVADNGIVADTDWDGEWKSAGAWTKEGWSAEMSIPFTTIKFQGGKDRTWGVQFSRYFPRNFEKSFWTGPLDDYRKVSTNGALTGLNIETTSDRHQVVPHIISQSQQHERTHVEVGLDASYAFSRSVSGYLTLNPDFSTVEADREQVNLTRFELNLPEKRQFFLEGNDAYKQTIRLFYSRRIADIYGGLKAYGKTGPYEISALSAQTDEEGEEGGASANFSVFRLKRDIMGSSNIGVVGANRIVSGRNQGSVGLDANLFLTNTIALTGQAAASYRDGARPDFAFFVGPSYNTQTFLSHVRYTYLGDRFGDIANAVGYIPDDNRHEIDSAMTKTFWLKTWGLDRIEYKALYDVYWGMDRTLRSWEVQQALTFDLQNKLSFGFRYGEEYKLFEKEFRNHSSTMEVGYNTRQWRSLSMAYQWGRNFDSDFVLLTATAKQNLTRDLSIEYDLSKLSYSPDPNNQSTWIHVIVANQYFTKDLFCKVFYQINSAIDKRNIQVVFAYRFQPPFGLVQVAYQKGTAKFGEAGTQGHTLFLKFAYVL